MLGIGHKYFMHGIGHELIGNRLSVFFCWKIGQPALAPSCSGLRFPVTSQNKLKNTTFYCRVF